MCHWNIFSSLIEVLLQAPANVPLEISLQECSYFQQVLFVEFLPSAFFQSKARKMHFYAWHWDFILKLAIVFIHSCIYYCLRLLCKIAYSRNLLIIKFSLWAFLFCPRLGLQAEQWMYTDQPECIPLTQLKMGSCMMLSILSLQICGNGILLT